MADVVGTKTRRENNTVSTLYQVNPSFYEKILSRTTSLGYHSRQSSVYCSPGKVPFTWENQPGKPRADDALNQEAALPPIRLPPAVQGLSMPRPSFPSSGLKTKLLKSLQKLKTVKSLRLRVPPAVKSLTMPRPETNGVPKSLVKILSHKKVKKFKDSINVDKIRSIRFGKKEKSVSPVTSSRDGRGINGGGTVESDGFEPWRSSPDDSFTPNFDSISSNLSVPSTSASSLSSSLSTARHSTKPSRGSKSSRRPALLMRWRFTKPGK